jgi:hypothetical protein|tara:strand:+ start:447 stop:722 length:276 start_codon:yes stop_codon:yes gene_type:complete
MTNKDIFKETFPLQYQEGGEHYKNLKIQPFTFCRVNNLNTTQSNIIKYASRLYTKGDVFEQLDKIIHYCNLEKDHLRNNGEASKKENNKSK